MKLMCRSESRSLVFDATMFSQQLYQHKCHRAVCCHFSIINPAYLGSEEKSRSKMLATFTKFIEWPPNDVLAFWGNLLKAKKINEGEQQVLLLLLLHANEQ